MPSMPMFLLPESKLICDVKISGISNIGTAGLDLNSWEIPAGLGSPSKVKKSKHEPPLHKQAFPANGWDTQRGAELEAKIVGIRAGDHSAIGAFGNISETPTMILYY